MLMDVAEFYHVDLLILSIQLIIALKTSSCLTDVNDSSFIIVNQLEKEGAFVFVCLCVCVCVPIIKTGCRTILTPHIHTQSLSLSHTQRETHMHAKVKRKSIQGSNIVINDTGITCERYEWEHTDTHNTETHTHMVCSKLLGFTKTGRDGHLINKLPKKL